MRDVRPWGESEGPAASRHSTAAGTGWTVTFVREVLKMDLLYICIVFLLCL